MKLAGLFVCLLMALLSGCDSHDSDFYPYAMTGLDVWVSDNRSGRSFYGGRVSASYTGRAEAARTCGDMATVTARGQQLRDWGYVCCTVTSSSDCVTKVR